MSARATNDEIDTLISSYLDGSLQGDALAAFNRRVATDTAFASRLYQIAHLHGSLREIGTSGAENLWGNSPAPADGIDVPLPLPALASSGENRPRGNRSSVGAWMAACLFLAAGAAVLYTVWPKNAPTLAMITQARNVWIVRDGNQILVTENMELREGDMLRTANNGSATVDFTAHKLKLEVEGGSHLAFPARPENGDTRPRLVDVEQGIITATVQSASEGAPIVFSTPQGEVSLKKETRTTVASTNAETRLDVHEGQADLSRSSDAKKVSVAQGQYAVAGTAVEMAALPFATPAKEKEEKETEPSSVTAPVANAPTNTPNSDEPLKPWEMNITGFHVLDAETGEAIPELSPLFYGTLVEKKKFPNGFTIQAITSPEKIGSIVFLLNGQRIHVANNPPYAVTDGKGKGFKALDLAPGMYNLKAIPHTNPDGKGKPGPNMVVRFQVVRQKGGGLNKAQPKK